MLIRLLAESVPLKYKEQVSTDLYETMGKELAKKNETISQVQPNAFRSMELYVSVHLYFYLESQMIIFKTLIVFMALHC